MIIKRAGTIADRNSNSRLPDGIKSSQAGNAAHPGADVSASNSNGNADSDQPSARQLSRSDTVDLAHIDGSPSNTSTSTIDAPVAYHRLATPHYDRVKDRGSNADEGDDRQGGHGRPNKSFDPCWKDGLTANNHGAPMGNLCNALHALRNAPEWRGVLTYDEFAARVVTRKPPPWSNRIIERWTDDCDSRACAWLQKQGIPTPVGVVGRAIQTVAKENPVHPVREYLNALNWDGTPRLDRWLSRYFGVEDGEYVRAIGSRFLIQTSPRTASPTEHSVAQASAASLTENFVVAQGPIPKAPTPKPPAPKHPTTK
jgi:hypothetical protein